MRRHGPALLLAAYGGAFALLAFGAGTPAFDDHPGQYFRLWHALERSVSGGYGPADWNPDWWGGYPELQFYPPGFALAGALIRGLLLWQVPVDAVYRLLCAAVFLLPAVTTFWLVTRLTGDGWIALPPAFLALTLSAGLRGGVEESVRWGMLTSRLALGGLPVLVLALRRWVDEGRPPPWTPLVAAWIGLAHPAGGATAGQALALAAVLAGLLRPARARVKEAAVLAALTAGVAAFWWVPLLVRRVWLVPLAWGPGSLGGLWTETGSRPLILALLLLAPLGWVAVARRRRPGDAVVAALPAVLLTGLALDAWLFRSGWSPIEPARLADALVLSLTWSAALGAAALGPAPRRRGGPRSVAVAALLTVAAAVALALLDGRASRGEPTLTLWPTRAGWPTLERVSQEHDLPLLWAALRPGADRVLFLHSGLRLGPRRGVEAPWYAPHSHVTSLTPLMAGREIVHGTFTHPSPVAARFYVGAARPDRLAGAPARLDLLAEQLDGQRLLGRPWEALDTASFDVFARRLRVATVVVPSPDAPRARFLGPAYGPGRQVAGFTIFERRDRPWPAVERITHRRLRVTLRPEHGLWIGTGVAAYPLWQVKSRAGSLPTRADAWGLLEFHVPFDVFEAELVYREGWAEWTGLALTLLAGLGWLVWAWRSRAPGAGRRRGRAATGRNPARSVRTATTS